MTKKKQANAWIKLTFFLKEHWDKILLVTLFLSYSLIFSSLSILRHNAFASNFDLSNMDQTLWFTLHGHFFSLRLPDEITSRLAVHADFILALLSPLYLIKDDVRILLVFQSVSIGLGSIPVYLLAKKILKNKIIAFGVVLSYLLNPAIQWTNIYDFHAVALAIPLLLTAFYLAYSKRWNWFLIVAFLAILTKEQISLNIAMLGLIILFVFKNKKIGIPTFFIGIIWFAAMVYVVMPHFSSTGSHWVLSSRGETNFLQSLEKFQNSEFILRRFITSPKTVEYYKLLLEPFAYLPVIGFPWLLFSAPDFVINMLMGARNINLHYDSGTMPAIVIATIYGLSYIKRILLKIFANSALSRLSIALITIVLVVSALRANYFYGPLPTTPSCWCYIYNVTYEDKEFEKILQNLPNSEIITSSLEIRPHVNHRPYSFALPNATESAKFIALMTQNRIIGNYEPKAYENELLPILLASENHILKYKGKYLYLFERIDN